MQMMAASDGSVVHELAPIFRAMLSAVCTRAESAGRAPDGRVLATGRAPGQNASSAYLAA